MAVTLVINHHSLMSENCVASTFEQSTLYLNSFFKTWQHALNKNICEKYIACDTEIWNWDLGEDKNLDDYTKTLKRDAYALTLQLLKITKKTSLEYFADEILEIVTTENSASYKDFDVPLLGCTCLSDGAVSLSLNTAEEWQLDCFKIEWKTPILSFSPNEFCRNFSTVEHIDEFCTSQQNAQDLTQESFQTHLATVQLTKPFWDWFEGLNKDDQYFIIDKARFCEKNGWTARRGSPYTALVGTNNSLHELRVWPVGKTLRVYIKRESDTKVLFLGGSDKDGQTHCLAKADSYYSENFSK